MDIGSKAEEAPKRYPALIRITAVTSGYVYLVIPSWKPRKSVRFPIEAFPEGFRSRLAEGQRYVAQVNLAADKPSQLSLKSLEPAPEPVGNFYDSQ